MIRAMTSVAASAPGASFDARLSAYLIDGLIIFVPTYPIVFWSFVQRDFIWWPLILWDALFIVYFTIFWSRLGRGQTPGMRDPTHPCRSRRWSRFEPRSRSGEGRGALLRVRMWNRAASRASRPRRNRSS